MLARTKWRWKQEAPLYGRSMPILDTVRSRTRRAAITLLRGEPANDDAEAQILGAASDSDRSIARRWAPFTMASSGRLLASIDAARYVCKNSIPGSIVECGVWRGGCSGAMLDVVAEEQQAGERSAFLYDTFEGMSAPSERDVDGSGRLASVLLRRSDRRAEPGGIWCFASLADVQENIRRSSFPFDRVRFVEGPVEKTLLTERPESIAILRLDTDWYESTAAELRHLYDLVSPGGVVIIDDYGHWQGARLAVDEFLASRNLHPLLARSDYTGRMFVKPGR